MNKKTVYKKFIFNDEILAVYQVKNGMSTRISYIGSVDYYSMDITGGINEFKATKKEWLEFKEIALKNLNKL